MSESKFTHEVMQPTIIESGVRSSAEYVNRYGMKNIITSFRCSESLRNRLIEYADANGRDTSSVIREAVAEYLRNRNTSPVQNITGEVNGWTAKSTKL